MLPTRSHAAPTTATDVPDVRPELLVMCIYTAMGHGAGSNHASETLLGWATNAALALPVRTRTRLTWRIGRGQRSVNQSLLAVRMTRARESTVHFPFFASIRSAYRVRMQEQDCRSHPHPLGATVASLSYSLYACNRPKIGRSLDLVR